MLHEIKDNDKCPNCGNLLIITGVLPGNRVKRECTERCGFDRLDEVKTVQLNEG